MSTIADLVVKLGIDGEDLESGMEAAAGSLDRNFGKITAAGVAGGAALEGFARSNADTNATLERLAITSGVSSDALRDSASQMSNHTFMARDAVDGMERLTQSGVTQQSQFEDLLPVYDALADATGGDLVAGIDQAEALLGPFGQGVEDVGDNVDQMTRMLTQTNVPLGSLGRNLARVPDELQALEFGLDDAAAGVEVFRDRGFEGKEAVREFRRAVADSEGDMGAYLDSIGLTAEEWAGYQDAVEPVPGLMDDMAAANTDQMTAMEKLQANIENLMFKYGGLADAASTLAMPMLALGPIGKGVSLGLKGIIKVGKGMPRVLGGIGKAGGKVGGGLARMAGAAGRAGIQVATAFGRMAAQAAVATARFVAQIAIQVARWAFMGAQALLHAAKVALAWLIALGPIAIVAAAVIAFVALLIANWDTVVSVTTTAFGAVTGAISAAFGWVQRNWPQLLAILTGPIGLAVLAIVRHWGTIKDGFTAVKTWIGNRVSDIVSFFSGMPGRLRGAAGDLWGFIVSGFKTAINAVIRLWNNFRFPSATFSLPKIDTPLGSIGGGSMTVGGWSLPRIPELAEGGIIKATPGGSLFRGGEGGEDEAVVPLPRGVRSLAGGGGPNVTVNVAGSIRSDRDLVKVIRDELDRGGLGGMQ